MKADTLLKERSATPEDSIQSVLDGYGLEMTPDGEYVRWTASNCRHPRNWSASRKIYDSSLIIFLEFFTYLLAQCGGGIIFPSYSETFGRKKLYIFSTAFYSISCLIVGVASSIPGVIVGRAVSGFLSAIPTIIVAGSIEDLFNSKGRVWMIFLWAMVANLGLILGPIISAHITMYLGWQWMFYIAAMVTAVVAVLMTGIRESRPSLLLVREVAKVREETGIDKLKALNPDHAPNVKAFIEESCFRPVQLFFTEPIVFMVATIGAIAFALVYLFTEALPPIYQSEGFSVTASSLPFLAIGIGLMLGFITRIVDHKTIARCQREGTPLQPEHKLIGFSIGAPMLAIGLWWFAWTIPPKVTDIHWIASAIPLVLIGYALNEFDAVLAGYVADSYLSYAASGFAMLSMVRSTLSAVFPLFAPYMFNGLGANVAASILAAVATVFCVVPPLFTKYGHRIRARSKFARYSLEVYQANGVDKDGY